MGYEDGCQSCNPAGHYCDSESACTNECKGTWCGADSNETAALVQSKIPEPANGSSGGCCYEDGSRVATLRATTATRMIRAVMNARARGVVLQHQLHRRRQQRREVVATKMDARVATLRATTATPSPRALMNARGRGVVLIL